MSAGKFTRSTYESDDGKIRSIRVQPETLAATLGGTANAAPAGTLTTGLGSAKVSGSRRSLGCNARTVTLQFTGAVPDGYMPESVVTIPILTKALFDAVAKGTTGVYLGVAVIVLFKTPEYVN